MKWTLDLRDGKIYEVEQWEVKPGRTLFIVSGRNSRGNFTVELYFDREFFKYFKLIKTRLDKI